MGIITLTFFGESTDIIGVKFCPSKMATLVALISISSGLCWMLAYTARP